MAELLRVAQGDFSIRRLPLRRNELLRAWDAADEYLLNYIAETVQPPATAKLLLINDSFGALAVALSAFQPLAWSDSYLSQQATQMNLRANDIYHESVQLVDSTQTPAGPFNIVLLKVPKTLAFLEDLLIRLRPCLTPDTQIIVTGMLKNLPGSVWTLLERIIGPTQSSLAKKKARLIFCRFDPDLAVANNPYPSIYPLENTHFLISNHSNVFSREQLDIGTRFFLAHLPTHTFAKTIVDLGCGNGVVGLMAAVKNSDAAVFFVDESYMAVASARQNFNYAFNKSRQAIFSVGDGLESFAAASIDLILCNPPFHQQQTIGDHLAMRMFKQAYNTLAKNGELWIVGNRHLGYQASLNKIFGNCEQIAANSKFVILRVIRTA